MLSIDFECGCPIIVNTSFLLDLLTISLLALFSKNNMPCVFVASFKLQLFNRINKNIKIKNFKWI